MEKFWIFFCWLFYFSCLENEQYSSIAEIVGKFTIALLPYLVLIIVLIYQKLKEKEK